MKILFHVNQAECFRRGIDAPQSTVKFEIHPGKLPEDIRVFVADALFDGYKFGIVEEGGKEVALNQCMLLRPDLLGAMEAFLRARDFEESDDTHFGEWLKKQDAAANTEREKRAEELMEAQKVSHDDSWEAA